MQAIKNLKPGGTFVQVGTFQNTNISIPSDVVMTKELTLKSSFRFDKEFSWAADILRPKESMSHRYCLMFFPWMRLIKRFSLLRIEQKQ
ncbi:MAG: hypothetical protein CM15mP62_13660 [Rhodospirillaceae bacterium]|nr:MAG: hypothetical protein CM15mP62_13660 [Rhodospirillaceae bacterium]